MKVAIMGAGLAGLSCAIMLERHGIYPTIYEKHSQVGDRFINGEAFLSLLTRPINDVFQYFSDEYQLFLKPSSSIQVLNIHSKNEKVKIHEHVGFVNIRGRHHLSLENQLAEQVKSEIILNSTHTYENLLEEYTHVIMATGDASYAMKLNNFREDLSVTLKGATVQGNFDRYTVYVWLNNDFAPQGYAYLLPFNEREANIVIAFPDLLDHNETKITELWERFYTDVCADLQQALNITDQFQVHNYQIGICKSARIGNTFFTGNCFGSVMPFIGFGQFEAILTGIYAAYDLIGLGSYEKLTSPFKKRYEQSLTLRRAMEKLTNDKFNFIVKNMNHKLVKKLFEPSKHNPLRTMSYLLKPFGSTASNPFSKIALRK